jgi:hypothetical protein
MGWEGIKRREIANSSCDAFLPCEEVVMVDYPESLETLGTIRTRSSSQNDFTNHYCWI